MALPLSCFVIENVWRVMKGESKARSIFSLACIFSQTICSSLLTMSTLPDGNYTIEFADPHHKGLFVSVDDSHNNTVEPNVELSERDSSKVQVWKLERREDIWSFQGVSPKVDGEKFICISNDGFIRLIYTDSPSFVKFFQIESVTGSQDTFRCVLLVTGNWRRQH
ncbi:hypothetical protein DEU56DRAFT_80538 [Suillus clintonianus]|uniref:uncharacterized protein n=1 Tax=Suillus clintonianus TaxID=1904413 RepID=UPI001B85F071|nr:uncharacterized protein DEU56DRAFT_80538 [Suillus clintonianus]KAG2148781.1 hypothetical protein DEU56DRAFT_80538 [Suillus clintonianus]